MDNVSAKARIKVCRPKGEVFSAFADAGKMSQFWFTRRDSGLKEGESVTFYMGSQEGAFSFDANVIAVDEPNRIVIEWADPDDITTQVVFSFDETAEGDTILAVEETGFGGSDDNVIARALDSTGGFNQVILAAKAFVEHGVAINVVADHA